MKYLFKIPWSILLIILIGYALLPLNSCKKQEDTISDINGNVYKTVNIGSQTWMTENLKTTKLNDGTSISLVTDYWSLYNQPSYSWYNNDSAINKDTYGALYNFYTVSSNKLCPKGWHVPSKNEWNTLITYLIDSVASGKLRESGTTHWTSPNKGANNSSGFRALPAGMRSAGGQFYGISTNGFWWSSTEEMAGSGMGASSIGLYWLGNGQLKQAYDYRSGLSVRCIQDN
jgi:uncharacterized protein (TIGR02145 family)